MYKNVFLLITILANCLNVSCISKKTGDGVSPILTNPNIEIINIDSAKVCDKMLFSSYFKAPSIVILETNKKCVVRNIRAIDYYNNKFYILDDETNVLYVFANDGSFIQRIGDRGNGHGEYLEISDFSIDREKGEIYLWDEALDKAHKYNINTCDYISSIQTERNGERSFCMQYFNGRLYVNRTSIDDNGEKFLLKEIDAKTGQQTATYLDANYYNKGWNYPLRYPHTFFYAKNSNSPKYVEMFSDTIVSITANGIIPSYVVKSHDFIRIEDINQFKREQNSPLDYDMITLYKKQRISHISGFTTLKNAIYMEYLKGENNYYLIYDETKKETVISSSFVNDYVSKNFNVPMNICYSDEQGILAYIRPEHISYFIEHFVQKGIIDHNLEQYERLIQLKEDANPILFYHKFRE